MASDDDKKQLDRTFEALSKRDADDDEALQADLEELAQRVEEPGLQDRILDRYLSYGKKLLSDSLPSGLDPRVVKKLEPILGDVSNVRVHTGAVAAEAAKAMEARAFAIGDQDIFVDPSQLDMSSDAGSALLAHEVAHTRDAATGFALSARRGSQTSDREAFARDVELAIEDAPAAAPPDQPAAAKQKGSAKTDEGLDRTKVDIDKAALEEKVWQILQRQGQRSRDRHGS